MPSWKPRPRRAARNNQHGDDLAVDANHHRAYIEDMERHTPTQGETKMTTANSAYRAAYWISADSQSDLVLTTEEMAGYSAAELMAEAQREMEATGLIREDGDCVVIGDYLV
jgi:hypothetical protein